MNASGQDLGEVCDEAAAARQLELDTPQLRREPKFVRHISSIVVDRRAKVQIRLAKPLVCSALLCGGATTALVAKAGVDNLAKGVTGVVALAAAALVAWGTWAFWRTIARPLWGKAAYVPGKTFPSVRKNDAGIARHYQYAWWGGIAALVVVLALALVHAQWATWWNVGRGLFCAISSIGYGYYGRIAKQLHADVDAVAVATLRAAGVIKRERVLGAHQNFDPTVPHKTRDGHATLGVLADRLVLLYAQGGQWQYAQVRFDEIAGLGLYENGLKVMYCVELRNGATHSMSIDATVGLTTETKTFTRMFLSAFDSSLSASSTPAVRSRRVVAAPAVVPAPAPETQRALELDPVFVAQAAAATPVPAGRSLELFIG